MKPRQPSREPAGKVPNPAEPRLRKMWNRPRQRPEPRDHDVRHPSRLQGLSAPNTRSTRASPATAASARWRSPTTEAIAAAVSREAVAEGPRDAVALVGDSCPSTRPARGLPVGNSPLVPAPRLAEELGLGCELYVKTETSNPTHSFKDRVVAVAAAKARRARVRGAGLCVDRATWPARRPPSARRSACPPTSSCPTTWSARRSSPPPPTAHRVRGQRHLRRRQPALLGAGLRAAVGVRQRQHARLLRRGLEDHRAGDGRAAGLAGARPGGRADRLRVAVHQDPAGFQEARPRAWSTTARPAMHGAQGAGCAPVAEAYADGADDVIPVRPTGIAKSLAIGAPADGVLRPGASPAAPAARSSRSTTTRSSTGIRLLARPPASSPRRPAASPSPCSASWRSAETSATGETVVAYITGDGLKTIDAVSNVTVDRGRAGRCRRRSTRCSPPRCERQAAAAA